MNNLLVFVSSVFSADFLSDDMVVIVSQVLFTALLLGLIGYHFDRVNKDALKAEKIALKESPRDCEN